MWSRWKEYNLRGTNRMESRLGGSSVLVVLLVLSGYALRHVSAASTIEPDRVPSFNVAGPVQIINAQQSSEDVSIPIPLFTLTVNYGQYTESAIRLLKAELDKRSGVAPGSTPKRITVAIVDLRMIALAGTFRCIVNHTVETGDGYRRGIEVIGGSWDFRTAIDAAVANVAVSVLNDEKILSYLEK